MCKWCKWGRWFQNDLTMWYEDRAFVCQDSQDSMQAGLHHVIGRGINGVKIFDSRKDRENFLERRTFIGSTFLFIQGQGQFSLKSFGILIGGYFTYGGVKVYRSRKKRIEQKVSEKQKTYKPGLKYGTSIKK